MTTREATHAGSWYDSSKSKLTRNLDDYLSNVPAQLSSLAENDTSPPISYPIPGARAIIAPHAGYAYSGPAAAWAYKALDWSQAKRIFLLGPSHHYYLSNCALSRCSQYGTPLGDLALDLDTIAALRQTGQFGDMSRDADEEEHSLEMHLPYIYKMLAASFKDVSSFPPLVPILVGNTKEATEVKFGEILAPYLEDPGNFFVISSDFCHWGSRFRYTYYVPANGKARHLKSHESISAGSPAIHESIAQVDRESWEAIETGEHAAFLEQVERTGNTVCGRHPIGVMMSAIEKWRENGKQQDREQLGRFRFVRYERSSLVQRTSDSSVSYCSAYAVI